MHVICDECDLTVPTPKSLWKEAAYYIFSKQLQESEMPLSDDFFQSRFRGRCHPWADPEGGQGVRTPLKNQKNIGFPSNIDPDSLNSQSYQARIQSMLAIIGTPAKRHFNSVPLVGR